MNNKATCIPFLRVPNIARTISWYESIGFKCVGTNHIWEPDCELNWAELNFEGASFMLYPSDDNNTSRIKDAGLDFNVEEINDIIQVLKKKVEIVEIDDETFYGRKEVVIQDINGFQITFSCEPKKQTDKERI